MSPFITFEGGEGSGKTTQIASLAEWLRGRGDTVLATREPGGDAVAESIRSVLLEPGSPVHPRTELLLFLAARAQVTEQVIRPALDRGEIVLCDRFIDSTVVYQGHARGHDLTMVRDLNAVATGNLLPNLTILLDIDVEIGLARQQDRNRMEDEAVEFHEAVRAGYLAEAALFPERFVIIDASLPAKEIGKIIHKVVIDHCPSLCRRLVPRD
jgi:dTMP kinase